MCQRGTQTVGDASETRKSAAAAYPAQKKTWQPPARRRYDSAGAALAQLAVLLAASAIGLLLARLEQFTDKDLCG